MDDVSYKASVIPMSSWRPKALDEQDFKSDKSKLIHNIIYQAVEDINEILRLEQRTSNNFKQVAGRVLANFWGAKKFFLSKEFENMCELVDLEPQAIRDRLKAKLIKGREIYGKIVRTLTFIWLPVDDETEELENELLEEELNEEEELIQETV